ncbi:MAG: protein kinase domain-containing protein [Verrucomicrobiales bacterium]
MNMQDPPPADAPTIAEPVPVGGDARLSGEGSVPDLHEAVVGTHIGRYKLLQKIGEGGWGVVYMAEQEEPVRRRLALKIIKLGMDTKSVIARFEAERQALAMMDHPNIARVLDAGATETGRPFFVMELVRGISVTTYCDQHSLPMEERLRLFVLICQAVQHAHQKGIIHRDLKPSNILISHHDGRPVPKVIDFGIAKASEARLTDKTLFTAFEQFIGTPAYMSPEQAEMSSLDIDTRSDIYSLGVLLYELLTGRTPFASGDLAQAGLEGMRRILREHEPSRPSTRLQELTLPDVTSAARRRQVEPGRLAHLIQGDLDWIVMKAIDKDRTRRYATAHELAADVERYLTGEAVTARPPSQLYRLRKLVRRHRFAVTGATATVAALAVGLAVAIWQYREKKNAWQVALAAESEKSRLLGEAQAAQATEAELREAAERLGRVARHRAYAADINLAQQALESNNLARAQELLTQHKPASSDAEDLRGWEWFHLWQECQGEALYTLSQIEDGVRALSVSGDRRWVAMEIGRGGEIAIWDLATQREATRLNVRGEAERPMETDLGPPPAPSARPPADAPPAEGAVRDGLPPREAGPTVAAAEPAPVASPDPPSGRRGGRGPMRRPFGLWEKRAEFSPADDVLAFARSVRSEAGDEEHSVRLWKASTGDVLKDIPLAGPALQLALSVDAQRLWVATEEGRVSVYEMSSGTERFSTLVVATGRMAPLVRPSPDLELMAMAESNGPFAEGGSRLRLVATATGEEKWSVETNDPLLRALTFSPDGRLLAVGTGNGADSAIRLWDTENGREVAALKGHRSQISSLVFWPDGRTLASASEDRTIRLWDVKGERQEAIFRGHRSAVRSLGLMPDGSILLSAGADGAVLAWDTNLMRRQRSHFELAATARAWHFATDSASVITLNSIGRVSRWHGQLLEAEEVLFETGEKFSRENAPPMERLLGTRVAQFSGDGGLLALAGRAESVEVWDVEARRIRTEFQPEEGRGRVSLIGFVPGSTDLLTETGGPDGRIARWDALTGKLVESWRAESLRGGRPLSALSSDGRWLVRVGLQGQVSWRDLGTGVETNEEIGLAGIHQLAFSPDSRLLVAVSDREGGRIWDVLARERIADLGGFLQGTYAATFSTDSRRLALGSTGDEAIKIWDLASQRELVTLEGSGSFYHTIRFSRDGTLLAASNLQGRLSFWRAPRPAER